MNLEETSQAQKDRHYMTSLIGEFQKVKFTKAREKDGGD
jgi:hypothetical protein